MEERKKRKKNYLNNEDMLHQLRLSHAKDSLTDELARMLQMLCKRYASRGKFSQYTYNDDMQSHAMLTLVKCWKSFNPEKGNNPFAYFTQCIHTSFLQFLNSEKKQRNIRDELLINNGYDPSFSFALEYEMENYHYLNNDDSFSTPDIEVIPTEIDTALENTEKD